MDIKIDRLIRSKRKTISLEITSDAILVVRAPLSMSKAAILKALNEKSAWIIEKLRLSQERKNKIVPISYSVGEKVLFQGKELTLMFSLQQHEIAITGSVLILPESFRNNAQSQIERWFKQQALKILKQRVETFASAEGFHYRSVKISNAVRRWGSCGGQNTLNFSWRLVMAPPEVLDYVVVHELSHTVHHDHSKAFWQRVASIMPVYLRHRQWLNENGGLMKL